VEHRHRRAMAAGGADCGGRARESRLTLCSSRGVTCGPVSAVVCAAAHWQFKPREGTKGGSGRGGRLAGEEIAP
jgi:hypothetical protein